MPFTTPITVSVPAVCSKVTTPFSQTLLASLDDSFDIKHALLDGKLPFHNHPENDELFYLLSGELGIDLMPAGAKDDDGKDNVTNVVMKIGDLFVVPKGVFHRPVGAMAHVLIMEKKGVPGGNGEIAQEA